MIEEFMVYAFVAALLASICCGIVGTMVVNNQLTFLAGGVAHAAYGGIGLAWWLGLPMLPCTIGFSVLASLVMGAMMLRSEDTGTSNSADTAIGVLWAAGMAFGIILIQFTPGYASNLISMLFGSLAAVSLSDIIFIGCFDVLLVVLIVYFRQGLWAISLDREFSRAKGLPVAFFFLLMIALVASTVVLLIRIVGLVLVIALLTIPPFIARKITCSLRTQMLLAMLFSFVFCCAGLLLSYNVDMAPGASIIAVASVCYFLVCFLDAISKRLRPRL